MKAEAVLLLVAPTAAVLTQFTQWYNQGWFGLYPLREYVSYRLPSAKPNLLATSQRCRPGYVFLEPRGWSVPQPGPLILDGDGELVWMEDKYGEVMDFRPQVYKGESYLTFWRGTDDGTHGRGTYYMLNSSYEVERMVNPSGDLDGDLHEFEVTEAGTALMTVYQPVQADLSPVGGPPDGWVHDGILLEVDIESGELVFEWRATSFYKPEDSLWETGGTGKSQEDAWDYFHINSIDKDPEGNYYVSSRYMFTVTCISPRGDVLWRLGGPDSDFTDLSDGAASNFSWNHHVRWHEGNRLTIFDNGAHGYGSDEMTAVYSRGMLVQLDLEHMTAQLLAEYIRPKPVLSASQGSVQVLDNGNVFVGWGYTPAYTEFAANGTALCDVDFGAESFFRTSAVKSYRGFKANWVGKPKTPPDIGGRRSQVYVSWNGATEVRYWQLQSAVDPDVDDEEFINEATLEKKGFESSFEISGVRDNYVRVLALDEKGEVLGTTAVFDTKARRVVDGAWEREDGEFVVLELFLTVMSFLSIGYLTWSIWRPQLRGFAQRFQGRAPYKYRRI